MPADLHAVAGVALPVGRVDDAHRQPEHAALDLLKHVHVHTRDDVLVANIDHVSPLGGVVRGVRWDLRPNPTIGS